MTNDRSATVEAYADDYISDLLAGKGTGMHSRCSALLQSSGLRPNAVVGENARSQLQGQTCQRNSATSSTPNYRTWALLTVTPAGSRLGEVLAANLHRVCPVPNQHPSGNEGGQDADLSVRFSEM